MVALSRGAGKSLLRSLRVSASRCKDGHRYSASVWPGAGGAAAAFTAEARRRGGERREDGRAKGLSSLREGRSQRFVALSRGAGASLLRYLR